MNGGTCFKCSFLNDVNRIGFSAVICREWAFKYLSMTWKVARKINKLHLPLGLLQIFCLVR